MLVQHLQKVRWIEDYIQWTLWWFICFFFYADVGERLLKSSNDASTSHSQRQFMSMFPQIDANALNDIEVEAQYLAANVDGITENLANLLHSVSKSKWNLHNRIIITWLNW